jgi:DNA-binding transcriptional LysR family regulator
MSWSNRIGRRLKLQDLNVLLTVVEAGTMSKAAALLNTTQPSVSRSIADLERTLGVPLLERTSRGVSATTYGAELLRTGTTVFNELRHGVEAIAQLADPGSGEVRITGNEPIIMGIVSGTLARLRQTHPGISIRADRSATRTQQLIALRERTADLVISRLTPDIEPDIVVEQLYVEKSHVVTGVSNPIWRRRKLSLDELIDLPWTLPLPDTLIGAALVKSFAEHGVAYPRRGAFGHALMNFTLASTGQFLAIVPESVLRFSSFGSTLKVVRVACPLGPWPVGIMRLAARPVSPVTERFIATARQLATTLR